MGDFYREKQTYAGRAGIRNVAEKHTHRPPKELIFKRKVSDPRKHLASSNTHDW